VPSVTELSKAPFLSLKLEAAMLERAHLRLAQDVNPYAVILRMRVGTRIKTVPKWRPFRRRICHRCPRC